MPEFNDNAWMQMALEEACKGTGLTSPNPPVGAVLVKDDRLIGRGWHRRAGMPHAEIEALRDAETAGNDVRGATAYVTLEPCSTQGRTGACTSALIAAGIERVVYGAQDPNPQHAGRANVLLNLAGIAVTAGVLRAECALVIRPFAQWITTGLPYVIAKAGQSLDGRLTRPAGEPQWLTSEASRQHAMSLRVRSDAILIGAETLRRDDPQLTLRGKIPEGKIQPWRVVITRAGRLPTTARLFHDEHKDRTLVLEGERGFREILQQLAQHGITTVLVEGGGNLLGQAFEAQAVDEVCWYIAPRICGGGTMAVGSASFPDCARSVPLAGVRHQSIGEDILITGYPEWPAESSATPTTTTTKLLASL